MNWFNFVSGNYPANYTIANVKTFVVKGKITAEQYFAITGETYQ